MPTTAPGRDLRGGIAALGVGAVLFGLAIALAVQVVGEVPGFPGADGPARSLPPQDVVAPVVVTAVPPPAVPGTTLQPTDGSADAPAGGGSVQEQPPTEPTEPDEQNEPDEQTEPDEPDQPVTPTPQPDPTDSGVPDGAVSALADPLVAGVTGGLDAATGGATAPLTGALVGVADAVTDAADGLLGGGRPGRG